MAIVIPPGFMQDSFRFQLSTDPEPMISTMGVDNNDTPTTMLQAICDQWIVRFPAAETLTQWTFLGATAAVGQDGGPPVTIEEPRSVIGTENAIGPPNNCALLIKKVTGLGGRKGRGRMFLPVFNFGGDNFLANGNLGGGVKTTMDTALAGLLADFDWVLLHSDSTPPTPITALVCDPKLATQRRRMRP